MELRPHIDYYYYTSLGNKFLKMDPQKIAHFTYSVFNGFSYENSLEVFMHDYGATDLMTVIDQREHFKGGEDEVNLFQKKTISELEEHKIQERQRRAMIKTNTLYRKTFLYN